MESRLAAQQAEIQRLSDELEAATNCDDLAHLASENKKLRYQVNILKKNIQTERANLKPLTGKNECRV